MGLGLINSYTTKILLAVQEGDSINQVSKKTGISYAYTHEWIQKLEAAGVIEIDDGIHVRDEEFRDSFETVAQTVVSRDLSLEDAYLLPNFSGLKYRFSRTDAVFVWTKGGYQIARNQQDYPIFIDVREEDVGAWQHFFDSYSIQHSIEDRIEEGEPGIYYVLFPSKDFEVEWLDGSRVMPLDETVEWMQGYEANFLPALEMLDEMYDLDLDVEYRERPT